MNELRELAQHHPQLQYTPAVLKGDLSDDITVGAIDTVILSRIPKLAGWRGFVVPAGILEGFSAEFLSGMASKDIYSDAFLPAAVS